MNEIQTQIELNLKERNISKETGNLLVITVGNKICQDVSSSEDLMSTWISLSINEERKLILITIPHYVGKEINLFLKKAFEYDIGEIIVFKYSSEKVSFEESLNLSSLNTKKISTQILSN